MKTLGPCDIDLSRLNPTPHAIAVYASSPLSPVATQHSLPSGRYPLLGPDFHRPDRTSLRLAHSFDHLVGEREQRCWHFQAECLSGPEVDHEVELGRLLDRKVPWLLAFENAANIDAGLTEHVTRAGRVGNQSASSDVFEPRIDRGDAMPCRHRNDLIVSAREEPIGTDKKCTGALAGKLRKRALKVELRSNL